MPGDDLSMFVYNLVRWETFEVPLRNYAVRFPKISFDLSPASRIHLLSFITNPFGDIQKQPVS